MRTPAYGSREIKVKSAKDLKKIADTQKNMGTNLDDKYT